MSMTWTDILIGIFFGTALVIGIYFTWVLLRKEMAGRQKIRDNFVYGYGDPRDVHSRWPWG